jgi:hypothetical protein
VIAAWRVQLKTSMGVASDASSRALVVLALAILVIMNPFWIRTAAIIGDVALPFETPTTDWRAARDVLAPWFAESEIVITTEELGAIYFLGRSDVRYSPNKLIQGQPDRRFEFGIDPRLGRPIIARPESLEQLMTCFRSGIVVGPIEHWGNPILVSAPVQDVIRRHAEPIDVPKASHLYAWGWSRGDSEGRPAHCARLDQYSGLLASH